MKKLLSLLLIMCSIGVAYADDKSTVTSLKYVTDELNTRQDKFGANDGKAMTFTNVAGGNLPRDVKASLGTSTSDNGLPTVSAVNTGIATKQDEIGAANTNTVVTYTGTPGTLGQKGIYQDTGTYAAQSDNLIQASTFNAALRNGLNNEFVCAGTDDGTANGNCWLWSIDNTTNETINVLGKNLIDQTQLERARIIKSDGTLGQGGQSFAITPFIKVTSGAQYTYSNVGSVAAVAIKRGAFYASADITSFVESFGNPADTTATITVPNTANYLRLNVVADEEQMQLEQGSTATTYEPYVSETVNVYIPQNQSAQNQ